MLDVARARVALARRSRSASRRAALPFGRRHFDLVVCQFGAMFFRTGRRYREACRVLKESGLFRSSLGFPRANPCSAAAATAVAALFPRSAELPGARPVRYHDPGPDREGPPCRGLDEWRRDGGDDPRRRSRRGGDGLRWEHRSAPRRGPRPARFRRPPTRRRRRCAGSPARTARSTCRCPRGGQRPQFLTSAPVNPRRQHVPCRQNWRTPGRGRRGRILEHEHRCVTLFAFIH